MLQNIFNEMNAVLAPHGAVCFYANVGVLWNDAMVAEKLAPLPLSLQQHLRSFKNKKEMQLSAMGKLLLLRVLHHFHIQNELSLEQLEEDQYRRPFFRHSLDFNIAHSGNLVICAGIMNRKIGVDIEQIKSVVIEDYNDLFTSQELAQIHCAPNCQDDFFRLWTRKEALLKAIGMGVYLSPSTLDVTADLVNFEGKNYSLKEVFVENGYCGCIAVEN